MVGSLVVALGCGQGLSCGVSELLEKEDLRDDCVCI